MHRFGSLIVWMDTKVCPSQRSANLQNRCPLKFRANNRVWSLRTVCWSFSTVSPSDTQMGKPVHSRHWCRRTTGSPAYSSASGTVAGLDQTQTSGPLVVTSNAQLECRRASLRPPSHPGHCPNCHTPSPLGRVRSSSCLCPVWQTCHVMPCSQLLPSCTSPRTVHMAT